MSFRREDQRHYGHVPPVQYPIASQPQQDQNNVTRRLSFNTGDDGAYYGHSADQGAAPASQGSSAADDELFLTSPVSPAPPTGRETSSAVSSALSGYQHQYHEAAPPTSSQSTYNPQSFAQPGNFQRSQSATLPYHPGPPSRYASTASTYNRPATTNYVPQVYNPAAYANPISSQGQSSTYGYGSDHVYGLGAIPQQNYAYNQSPTAQHPSTFSQPQSSLTPTTSYQTSPNPSNMYQYPHPSGYDSSPANADQRSAYNMNGGGTGLGNSPYGSASQPPYPTSTQMPSGPTYSSSEHGSYYNRPYRSDSQTSHLSSPRSQPPSSPGLHRHPTNAPLPTRPAENIPDPSGRDVNGTSPNPGYYQHITTESMIEDLEAELNGGIRPQRPAPVPIHTQYANEPTVNQQQHRQDAFAHHSPQASLSRLPNERLYDDGEDDDPEGTAAVRAMHEDEVADRRFIAHSFFYGDPSGSTNNLPPSLPPQPSTVPEEQAQDTDSDIGDIVDLGMLSGGYAGNLAYGNDVGSPPRTVPSGEGDQRTTHDDDHSPSNRSWVRGSYDGGYAYDSVGMDYGGTGGLHAPRLSFDAGDERVSVHSHQSGTESPSKSEYQDLFYHPGLTNRPLPPLPPGPSSDSSSMLSVHNSTRSQYQHSRSLSTDSRLGPPEGPEAYYNSTSQSLQPQPERSISLSGFSNTPQVMAPARSRTDAAEERKKLTRQQQQLLQTQQQLLQTQQPPSFPENEAKTPTSLNAFDAITLPSGRKRKLVPSKLTAADFYRCREPWALSSIEDWVRDVAEGDLDLKEKVVEDALIHLFTYKVPTMNVADAEVLSSHMVKLMLSADVLIPDEEWVKFGGGHVSGVLWQLTGMGCYAPMLHNQETNGRCYSYHCTRTLKKVDLDDFIPEGSKPTDEWHIFYHLKKEDWGSKPKKEVDRQNILHEIVTGEENYIKQLDVFRTLYRDDLPAKNPPIIHPNRLEKFLTTVFGKLDTVLQVNKEELLAQLKYRQQEQGPWITGFSDLFREWIRKAKTDYIEYATGYPRAAYMVRKEAERNILFKKFLEDRQKHKSSLKQDWTHFLITPLQRLQRYILLLESVEQKMQGDSEEKTNLNKAINEIRAVVLECDEKVAETTKRVEMMELDKMIVLRPGFHSVLNLDHAGRKLLMQGDLQRLGSKGMKWVDAHAFLFDHYFILAKQVIFKDGRVEKKYDVSREPIPMPLLFLESMNDEPVVKQKGITAPLARTTAAPTPGTQLNKVSTNGPVRPGLEHVATGSSHGSSSHLTQTTSNDIEGKTTLYPFKIKHLGHEVYTLYASSARDRFEWCNSIIEARTRHAKALYSQNAEPFRLRVLADASFNSDPSSTHSRTAGVSVKGTPLDRAIQDIESVLGSAQGIPPVCRAQVNCAVGFTAFGKSVLAIGTDYGVFITDPSNPRGWSRTVQASRVTQISVLEEFAVCLIISDKSLISYPLDVIAPVSEFAPPSGESSRRAPQRLAKDVTYFATARMKDRMLVFYKRREGLHTSFKVLEPILHKAGEKKSRLFGGRKPTSGMTESFREFDEFFFPTECYSLSLFQTYIAVATQKGIEMLTLDKKQPMSIPDVKGPAIANIANRIREQRPLGMFRLNENEFILTYEDCAVYVDRHGDVSRTLIMEYTGKQKKAKGATMFGQYLLLFNEDYVEVRNAENGRLRQIIAGRDVRIIDFGVRGPTGTSASQPQQFNGPNGQAFPPFASKETVKIAMSHPEVPSRQIVLEMLLNDSHAER